MRHLSIYRNVDVVSKVGSIRQAAELLAITPSALNRQILGLEEELGVPIFERLARGVRLSTAGELLIHHIRNQLSDLDRVQSQIADLSGVRRGHVSIACSQALLPYFLPQQIEVYRKEHPGVTFSVSVRDREAAEQALRDYAVDVAIIFEPVHLADCQTLLIAKQTIHAIMSKEHPLARRKTVKLEQCVDYPLALPSLPYGVRALMEQAATKRTSLWIRSFSRTVSNSCATLWRTMKTLHSKSRLDCQGIRLRQRLSVAQCRSRICRLGACISHNCAEGVFLLLPHALPISCRHHLLRTLNVSDDVRSKILTS